MHVSALHMSDLLSAAGIGYCLTPGRGFAWLSAPLHTFEALTYASGRSLCVLEEKGVVTLTRLQKNSGRQQTVLKVMPPVHSL